MHGAHVVYTGRCRRVLGNGFLVPGAVLPGRCARGRVALKLGVASSKAAKPTFWPLNRFLVLVYFESVPKAATCAYHL